MNRGCEHEWDGAELLDYSARAVAWQCRKCGAETVLQSPPAHV